MALAKLSIDIVAKLAEFERDLGKAARASDKAAEEIRKSFEGLKSFASDFAMGLAAGVGAALAGGALAAWVTDAADAADELARLSDQTGISVEKLSAWGGVARRNGQDVNDLAELTTEMSLRLAEIDKDSEGAGLALKQLGLDYKALAALPADEAFEAIAKAVAGTEDSGRKTALVMAALGDEAQKYVTTLNTIGAAGEMEASITSQQAEAAREYKDALAGLSAAGQDWSQSVVSGILPALSDAARALDDVMSGTDGLTAEARQLARDGTITDWARAGVTALTYLADAGSVVVRAFKIVGNTIAADAAIAGEAFSTLGGAAKQALSGDFAAAAETVRGGMARVKSISADADQALGKLWSEPTLGAAIRARIEDTRAFAQATQDAAKPPKVSVAGKTLVKADDSAAKAAAAAKKKADADAERERARALAEYEKLITSIRAKTEADAAEVNGTAAATEAQKMALEVMTQLRDGRLKLSDAQKQTVTQYLEEAAAAEQAAEAVKRQAAWLDESRNANADALDQAQQRTAALREQAGAERMQVAEFGLSAKALQDLRHARELDKAAALESRAAAMAGLDSHAELTAEWRAQADAIRDVVAAQRDRAAAEQASRENPVAGIQRALDDYRDKLRATGDDFQASFSTVASGIEDALAGAFSGSADGAKRLFETIKSEALKLLVIKPIMQQLVGAGGGNPWGALAGAAGALFGGGSVGNAGAGDYSSAGLAAAFGRASGGSVSAGSLHQVNERGPELVSTGGKDYLMMGGEGGFVTPVTPVTPASTGNTGRGSVQVTYAPQITIDSRSDRVQIMQDVAALNRRGQEEMMQTLKERGVV